MLHNKKGAVLVPIFYKNSFISVGRYLVLLSMLSEEFGFDIIETDDFSDTSYDVLIVLKSPNKGCTNLMSSVKSIPKRTKVLLYLSDVHGNEDLGLHNISNLKTEFYFKMQGLCNRADLILCPYKTSFLFKFPQFKSKFKFFPHFIDPQHAVVGKRLDRYNKCLISGALDSKVYPIRATAFQNFKQSGTSPFCHLSHPGYFKLLDTSKCTVGVNYINYLSNFTCALATASCLDYTVAKYFEIPLSGSLLVATHSSDLTELGFVDGKNFILVNKDNVVSKVQGIIQNSELYKGVALKGQELVLENYTKSIAYSNLKIYLENLFQE